ncbi:MAG: hypothetical protein M1838_003481 [Thelocarpon superellum]|nr:MAG: hypothetical protein M1838_003481 [Thelocarpon superellum]
MAEEEEHAGSSEPLRGVILCCTSVPPEQRSELASRVEQMGAIHKLDLTSDVTHLIVGDSDTPKYKYVAKERPDVKVLRIEWVEAIRQLWMAGELIDVRELEEDYRRPALAGLRICLTGFDDAHERQHLQTIIAGHGAEYHGDLTKSVTHLLANKTEGDKFKYARLWGLRIVSLEWLNDSTERGMILDEALYDPLLPVEERGKHSWVRPSTSITSLGKHARDTVLREEPGNGDGLRRRKLRRTASTKLQSQNSGIWNDIVGGGFADAEETSAQWDDGEGALRSRSRAQGNEGGGEEKHTTLPTTLPNHHGIFHGCCFFLRGFDGKKVLTRPPGFNTMTICSTAFSGVDLLHLSKVVRLMGATYDEYLSPQASVLISNTATPHSEKLQHALDWHVPVVSAAWLWDSVGDGVIQPFDPYILPDARNRDVLTHRPASDLQAQHIGRDVPNMAEPDVCLEPDREPFRLGERTSRARSAEAVPDERHGRAAPQSRAMQAATAVDSKADEVPGSGPTSRSPSPSPPAEDISTTIAALLARKRSSHGTSQKPLAGRGSSRRNPPSRLLGRAPSNGSARSASFSRASSVESSSAAVTIPTLLEQSGPEPSQKVIYDDPDVQEQRERVIRKMGGKVEIGVSRARSIGVARDVGGIGTRTRQRTHR